VALGDNPFIGSEALADGLIRKHQLRAGYRTVFPGVYVAKNMEPTLRQRAFAGWLWSRRHGVIAGLTASALHGAKWVDDCEPVELVWRNARCPPGLRTYHMSLLPRECVELRGLPVTTPERTAFDIGRTRRGRLDDAVARLDALGNTTGFKTHDVLRLADDHSGVRGLRQLHTALDLYDPGAASPKETWLRLLIIRAGYPRPSTQIPEWDPLDRRWYYLDLGWEELQIAMEYEGAQHRTDPVQFGKDVRRYERLPELGWKAIRVIKGDRPTGILDRLRRAWESRIGRIESAHRS
jgi:hypothetical protein